MRGFLQANRRTCLLLVVLALGGLATGCSKADKYKKAFMGQCVIVKPMEEACSCTYDRMTAEVPMEVMAITFEQGKRDPRVEKAIIDAMKVCTAKYR